MITETRRVLAFLAGLLLACLICGVVIAAGVWLAITILLALGSVIVPGNTI